jgi:4-hydroxy 2-oxovalerate aldolase
MSGDTNIKVLDCTIRDGGYINNWDFSPTMVRDVYRRLSMAGVDFIEIGFREAETTGKPLWRRCPEEELRKIKKGIQGAGICVMVDFGKAGAEDFLPAEDSAVDMVRIAVHKDKVYQALDLAGEIKDKGYMVSIQLMGYPQYETREREELFLRLKEMPLDYVYVADSYGSLLPDQLDRLVAPLADIGGFKVGFHPHNNLQLAFANALQAIKSGASIVDSTLYGMGRGAGNLSTETLLSYLQQNNRDKYNVIHALFCVDMYLLPLKKKLEWGYQLPFMLSAVCQCHPYYAKEVVEAREYTVDELWKILNLVKTRKPVGFKPELLEEILETCVFNHEDTSQDSGKAGEGGEMPESETGPPVYMGRHAGRPFLVLANGPNLKEYSPQIKMFIERYKPVVMGANYLGDLFAPDYHAFVNLRRFIKHVSSVASSSKLILSQYFSEDIIREHSNGDYEKIRFVDRVKGPFDIAEGVISNNCGTVSVLLVAVAVVMGASEVFVAGMDGYRLVSDDGGPLFYDEEDETESESFIRTRERWNEQALKDLESHMTEHGVMGPTIITPTTYEKYFVGINNFI